MILLKLKNEDEEQALRKEHLSDNKDYWQDELKSLGIEPDHLKNQPKVEEEELRALAESIKSVYYQAYKTAYSDSSNSNDNNNDKPLAKLLVVDDDSDIVQVLKMGLLKNGFTVNAFSKPHEALQSFKSNAESYCLVLSDMRIPGLSGMQLARKVKEINPNVKVVLMTAFEIRDEFSKVFPSISVDGFVQKPIGIRDLTNKILSIIGESKRRPNQD